MQRARDWLYGLLFDSVEEIIKLSTSGKKKGLAKLGEIPNQLALFVG